MPNGGGTITTSRTGREAAPSGGGLWTGEPPASGGALPPAGEALPAGEGRVVASGPALSVIVPATDRPATLGPCVEAIGAASGPGDELVLVDRPFRLGPAAARNEGARRAGREVLVFVDADVVVAIDALDRLRGALAADHELAAVFGSYDDAPAASGLVSRFRNLLHHHVHQSAPGAATTFWTGLGAVRSEAFDAVGGFDETRYPGASIEDVDLGTRLAAAGHRILLDPAAQGTHLKRWGLTDMVVTDFARRAVPWVKLRLRSGSGSTALNLGWRHRASALACLAGLVAAALRAPAATLGSAALLAWLNRSFYALLARRTGAVGLTAGVALHFMHHLTAVAAVPAGVAAHARERCAGARLRRGTRSRG